MRLVGGEPGLLRRLFPWLVALGMLAVVVGLTVWARQQEAAQIRAVGEQQKREIIASADKEVAITLATAQEEGETTRGQGDTTVVLSPDSDFFRYFQKGPGAR